MRQVKSLYMGSSESEKPMPTINDVLLLQGDASANVIMEWEQLGCRKADSGLWLTPAGQTCMTDQLATWVVDCLHLATHCGATLLVDALLQAWWHPRLKVLAAQTSARCLTCATHNPGKGVVCQTGRTPLPTAPFETLQMYFIDLPKCQCYKHVLVIVDVFSRWIEAFPTTDCTASTVVSILLRQVVPRFGVPNTISSDNGPHFIAAINKELYRQLGVTQRLHCAYRPQAAGMVERLNQTLKTKLAKLVDQSGSTWVKMLPVALFQIRVLPAGKTRLSPAKIIYGRPLCKPWTDIIPATMTLHHMTEEMVPYVPALTRALREIHGEVKAAYVGDIEFPVNGRITPGSYVLIKNWVRKDTLSPRWLGPFQVLLTTPTAVKVEGRSAWVHLHHCKVVGDTKQRWEVEVREGDPVHGKQGTN